MPSRTPTNTKQSKKAGSAAKRGAEAIQEALKKMELGHSEVPEFCSVQKSVGHGYFTIRNAAGKEYKGAAGHGGGKAHISIGKIVLAAYSATPDLPREILAVIDVGKETARLVNDGFMAQAVILAAKGAESVSTGGAPVEEDGYVFAEPEGGEGDVDVDAL